MAVGRLVSASRHIHFICRMRSGGVPVGRRGPAAVGVHSPIKGIVINGSQVPICARSV